MGFWKKQTENQETITHSNPTFMQLGELIEAVGDVDPINAKMLVSQLKWLIKILRKRYGIIIVDHPYEEGGGKVKLFRHW